MHKYAVLFLRYPAVWTDIPLGFSHVTQLVVLSGRWGLEIVTEFLPTLCV